MSVDAGSEPLEALARAPVAAASRPRQTKTPPGPRGLPVVGCLHGLLKDPMTFWLTVAERYGGIARVPLNGRAVYLVSDPELLHELLITNRHRYRKNTRYRAAVELFGKGLLLTEGEEWKRLRLLTQPCFKADYVAAQAGWMARLIADFLDAWAAEPHRKRARDVEIDFLLLAQLLAGYYLMGPAFAPIADDFCSAAVLIKHAWPKPPRGVLQHWLRRSPGWSASLSAAIAAMDRCLYGYLTRCRQTDFADAGVLGAVVRASRARGEEPSDRSLRDQLLSLFFAGHETTAMSLCWIHYLLATHPHARARLQREVHDVLGGRLPGAGDLDRLPYAERVINESLRLYSPIHSISRVALEDDTLGGFDIPAGSTIYVSLFATHRLARLWPDPHRFDPDRFTPEACKRRPRFAFIPFAAGHRNCIGGLVANVELVLAIAILAQRYELDVVPGQRVEPAAGTTVRPRFGLRMTVRPAPRPMASEERRP